MSRDEAVVELITLAMISGFMILNDRREAVMRELPLHEAAVDGLAKVLGDFPAEFVKIRSELIDAALSTPAVLS